MDLVGLTQWDDSMRTGEARVDAQHEELLRQMNLLLAATVRGEGASVVESTLIFLEEYAQQHFAHEEACMAEYDCPTAEANKVAHHEFLDKITQLRKDYESQPDRRHALSGIVVRELADWFTTHIRGVDASLADSIRKQAQAEAVD